MSIEDLLLKRKSALRLLKTLVARKAQIISSVLHSIALLDLSSTTQVFYQSDLETCGKCAKQ